MLAILAEILAIGGAIVQAEPQVLAIVQNAISAFTSNNQAALDAAHTEARALADSLAPAGAPDPNP
jgi:hypothetical protein